MLIENIKYVDSSFEIKEGSIEIENGIITDFDTADSDERIDLNGLLALPGFIDIHTHGGSKADACDKSIDSLEVLSQHYARHGVTSFCPTTMTLSHDELCEIFKAIEAYKGKEKGAYIHGINMEGPYVSKEKCGAQNTSYIRKASIEEFDELNSISKISLVDLAPEQDGALDFANVIRRKAVCSIAHTNATFEEAEKSLKNGFTHVTHFFNAMTPLLHRAPGVVGAVLADDCATVELICDGFHVDKAVVKLMFKLLGEDRIAVISDSLSSADCEDGEYQLGGQKVIVKNGKAHLEDGTIAGSTTNMFDEFKNLLSFGVDFKNALKACTMNPAKVIGVYDKCGSIEKGKSADIIFVDKDWNLKKVMIKGMFI